MNVPNQVKKYIPESPKPFVQNDDQIEDETIDWQTYENEKYGYNVKYPKDWKQNEEKRGIIISKTFENSMGRKEGGYFTIEAFDSFLADSSLNLLNKWIEINDPISPESEKEVYSLREIVINDNKGLGRKKINSVWGFTSEEMFVINENKVFKLSVSTNLSFPEGVKKQEEYDNTLNKILGTFKFIESKDERILLTSENIYQYNPPTDPGCYEKFNQDSPNTTIDYYNKEKGISFRVPYNSNWGNEKYKINPYEEYSDESGEYILFGSITDFEACSWVRTYALYFHPVKSAENIIKDIKKHIDPELFIIEPTKKSINGLDIVEYQSHGLCDSGELEVIGENYNYILRPLCGADFEFLENIVKSIELIN